MLKIFVYLTVTACLKYNSVHTEICYHNVSDNRMLLWDLQKQIILCGRGCVYVSPQGSTGSVEVYLEGCWLSNLNPAECGTKSEINILS